MLEILELGVQETDLTSLEENEAAVGCECHDCESDNECPTCYDENLDEDDEDIDINCEDCDDDAEDEDYDYDDDEDEDEEDEGYDDEEEDYDDEDEDYEDIEEEDLIVDDGDEGDEVKPNDESFDGSF